MLLIHNINYDKSIACNLSKFYMVDDVSYLLSLKVMKRVKSILIWSHFTEQAAISQNCLEDDDIAN